jgi:hypothetical protein
MTWYLELPVRHGGVEYVHAHVTTHVRHDMTYRAYRIWEQKPDGSVHYIKLRSQYISDMSQVDMKEFFWVKLNSTPIKRI